MAYISYTTLSHYFARVKHLAPSQVGQLIGGGELKKILKQIYSKMLVQLDFHTPLIIQDYP
jgi:hypothetical protein